MAFKAGSIIGEAILGVKKWNSGMNQMMKSTKIGITAITGVISAGFVKSIQAVDEFEKAFANVTTLFDTAIVDADKMQKELFNLDARLGSAKDLTEGLYQAISASVEPTKAIEFIGKAAEFAKAALIDTNTAVDVITTGLNAYGLEASKAVDISDQLFTVIKLGKTTGAELAATIGSSIPLAANLNIEFEELGASIAIMTRQGISAARATTQFNAIVSQLLKPSNELSEALLKLGFRNGEAAIQTLGLKGTLDALLSTTDGSKEALAKLFNNVRALKGVLALTGKGASDFEEILQEIEESSGATNEAFEKQRLTFETFNNSVDKLAISFGQEMLPVIDSFVSGLQDIVSWFTELDGGSKQVIIAIAGITAAALAMTVAFGPIGAIVVGITAIGLGISELVKSEQLEEIEKKLLASASAGKDLNKEINNLVKSTGRSKTEIVGLVSENRTLKKVMEDQTTERIKQEEILKREAILTKERIKTELVLWLVQQDKMGKTTKTAFQLQFEKLTALAEGAADQLKKEAELQIIADALKNSVIEQIKQLKIRKNIFGDSVDFMFEKESILKEAILDGLENGLNPYGHRIQELKREFEDLVNSTSLGVTTMTADLTKLGRNAKEVIEEDIDDTLENSIDTWEEYFSLIMGGVTSFYAGLTSIGNQFRENQKAEQELANQKELIVLDEKLANELITEEEYDLLKEELEKKQHEKMNE